MDRHIVQISNERENHVFATVAAVPAWREQPSGHKHFHILRSRGGAAPANEDLVLPW